MADDIKRCRWCVHASGIVDDKFIYCSEEDHIMAKDGGEMCDIFMREVGADDDRDNDE